MTVTVWHCHQCYVIGVVVCGRGFVVAGFVSQLFLAHMYLSPVVWEDFASVQLLISLMLRKLSSLRWPVLVFLLD